jgi:hypothetical protein
VTGSAIALSLLEPPLINGSLGRGHRARSERFGDHRPADTLFGVAALSDPEYLIEVDAIAVLDA